MSDAVTIAVIRDLLAIAGLALALALGVYAVIRARSESTSSFDGNVLSRPYGAFEGVVAVILLALISYLFTALPPEVSGNEESVAPSAGGIVAGLMTTLLVAFVPVVFLNLRGLHPAELFGLRQMPLRKAAVAGFAGLAVIFPIVLVVSNLVLPLFLDPANPDARPQAPVEAFQNAHSLFETGLIAFGAVVIAPISEEILFRGFLYGVTKRFTDRWFSALFTSLVFACTHVHIAATLPLFMLAMGFAIAYELTGSLLVPVVMHALFNATQLLLLSLFTKP